MALNLPWAGNLLSGIPTYTITFKLGATGMTTDANGNAIPSGLATVQIPVRLKPVSFSQAAKLIDRFPGADIETQFFKGWVNDRTKYKFSQWSPELEGTVSGTVTVNGNAGRIECQIVEGGYAENSTGQQFYAAFTAGGAL